MIFDKKYLRFAFIIVQLFFIAACKAQEESPDMKNNYTNNLIKETSPYLLQHANNPVNWYPWGDEALNKAKRENKLIIISIGYSACHWCHVMEHESFEDTSVAKLMNEFYVSIKVDREERPDVDQIYMDAAYLLTGRGGWPLNVVALPDGRPVFAGTYFPKENWLKVLNYFKDLYLKDPALFEQEAGNITNAINSIRIPGVSSGKTLITKDEWHSVFNSIKENIDFEKGGTKGAPKFPMPNIYEFLLAYNYHTENIDALNAVETTLTHVANGGIYDHLGGGFARYSTDDKWIVPHFEKMLYDNGQLVSLYSNAFKVTGNELYKKRVYETLQFVKRELTDASGGFYSSLDADSEGEEGKFYLWNKNEIDKLLGEDSEIFCKYYNISSSGNWEGKNILFISDDESELIKKYNIDEKTFDEIISKAKELLFNERSKRVRPGLDDKILTSWNALMLKGYVDAYITFDEKEFFDAAISNGNFILRNMLKDGNRLDRNYKNGKSNINAFLEDYAFTIDAFVSLYQATFDEKWLYTAKSLADYTIENFFDKESGLFYFTSGKDNPLITRKMDYSDNVTPSSNSSMAAGLLKLSQYFYGSGYDTIAVNMISAMKESILKGAAFHANWLIAATYTLFPFYEVAIVGKEYHKKKMEFGKKYLPNIILAGAERSSGIDLLKERYVEDKTMIYVCENKVCQLPEEEVQKALLQIR